MPCPRDTSTYDACAITSSISSSEKRSKNGRRGRNPAVSKGAWRERPHTSFAFARESALLLDLPARGFREVYFGETRAATRLRSAVQRSLLASMGRTNRALTRLLSQAKLDEATRVEKALETALHGQLTAAAD